MKDSEEQEYINQYLKLVKNVVGSATVQELFSNCNEFAKNSELREKAEEAINRVLPDGYSFVIDGAGIGHLNCPLYIVGLKTEEKK